MKKVKTLSIGIAVVDFVFKVESLPTEFDKYRALDLKIVGGGLSGNAAVACAKLGAEAHLITRLGNDETASLILNELGKYGVNAKKSKIFEGIKSPISSIFVDNKGERMIMSYSDETMPNDVSWLPKSVNADALSGDTRFEEGALKLFALAKAKNIPCVFDGDRALVNKALLNLTSHLAFSAKGLREMTAQQDLSEGLKTLAKQTDNFIAATDGANGVYYTHLGKVKHLPCFPIKAVDTLGAGDTWHGALTVALAEKQPIEQALRFANGASALKCMKFGGRAGIPTRDELDAFLKGN